MTMAMMMIMVMEMVRTTVMMMMMMTAMIHLDRLSDLVLSWIWGDGDDEGFWSEASIFHDCRLDLRTFFFVGVLLSRVVASAT